MHLIYRNAPLFEWKLDFAFSQRLGPGIKDEEGELVLRIIGSFTWATSRELRMVGAISNGGGAIPVQPPLLKRQKLDVFIALLVILASGDGGLKFFHERR